MMTLKRLVSYVSAGAIAGAALSGPVFAQEEAVPMSPDQVRTIVADMIREHPELIVESLSSYAAQKSAEKAGDSEADKAYSSLTKPSADQAKMAESLAKASLGLLQSTQNAHVGGNPNGDVTIVEFFDYNCPYCRASAKTLRDFVQADGNIRLIYRDWPVLSKGSYEAAMVAEMARKQHLYEQVHYALMGADGALDLERAKKIAHSVGMDVSAIDAQTVDPDAAAHIRKSYQLAKMAGFKGTPSFAIGNLLFAGKVDEQGLKEVVQKIRERGASKD